MSFPLHALQTNNIIGTQCVQRVQHKIVTDFLAKGFAYIAGLGLFGVSKMCGRKCHHVKNIMLSLAEM